MHLALRNSKVTTATSKIHVTSQAAPGRSQATATGPVVGRIGAVMAVSAVFAK